MRRTRRALPRRSRKLRRVFPVLLILLGLLGCFLFASIRIRPMVQNITAGIARQMMIDAIHQVVLEELERQQNDYADYVDLQRNEKGEILALSLNMMRINTLKSQIALTIQQELGESYRETGVPLGTLTGLDLLRGHGPKVPLRVSALGNTTVDVQSRFDSAGINQTRHQIVLSISTGIYSYLTGVGATADVTTEVPVAETVIVGEVPQMYASLTPESGTLFPKIQEESS